MAWTNRKGFNFRRTSTYVTDGTNETWVNFSDASGQVGPTYPATKTIDGDSVTYGYISPPSDGERDRSSSVDPRLAGIHYHGFSGTLTFRIDLPSTGIYEIHLAAGQATQTSSPSVEFYDDTTLLHTASGTSIGVGNFIDANSTVYSAASWPGSEAGKNLSFSTTTLFVKVPSGGPIAHFGIKFVSDLVTYDPITACFPIGYYE